MPEVEMTFAGKASFCQLNNINYQPLGRHKPVFERGRHFPAMPIRLTSLRDAYSVSPRATLASAANSFYLLSVAGM